MTNPSQEELFRQGLPSSLYKNHYDLAEGTSYSPDEWRQFLQKNRNFIDVELAAITEVKARAALERLGTGKASSAEVSGLRQILDKSKVINEKMNAKQHVLITFLPNPAKPPESTEPTEQQEPEPEPESESKLPELIFSLMQPSEPEEEETVPESEPEPTEPQPKKEETIFNPFEPEGK